MFIDRSWNKPKQKEADNSRAYNGCLWLVELTLEHGADVRELIDDCRGPRPGLVLAIGGQGHRTMADPL